MFPLQHMAHLLVHHDGIVVDCEDEDWFDITGTTSEPYDMAVFTFANKIIYRLPYERCPAHGNPTGVLTAAILYKEPYPAYKNDVALNNILSSTADVTYY